MKVMLAKFKPLFLVVMIVLALAPCAQAQEEVAGGADAAEYQPVPRQFRTLALGMPLDELRSVLTQDRLFAFRGERDVSFLPVRQETLVETAGNSFIRRAHFQLTEGEVFIMSFTLDTRRVDHYSVFMTFVNRYGQPVTLNPAEAVWEDDSTRVSIERPLTVKYIDLAVFRRLQEESQTLKAGETLLQERFLNEF